MKIKEFVEGKFRKYDVEEFVPSDEDLDDMKSHFLPDWEMLDHQYLVAKYVAKDHRHALEFLEFINDISEKMDHFTEVTQDVAEVKVRTSTFDVKGLTILDFKIALYIDKWAEKNNVEQVRMSGNFGMHEDLRKWFKEKWVRFGPDGKIRGQCARGKSSEGKPKCLPQSKAHSLGKKGRAKAASRKRREDPNPERKGPAKNVRTK
jgi:pterin-4a-carbinolamine dehydratase